MTALGAKVPKLTKVPSNAFTPTIQRRKPWDSIELPDSPVLIALDPGETTGWSVMMVHPECLFDPDVSILENIDHWSHGQIDCCPERTAEASRSGIPVIQSGEAEGVEELYELVTYWPGAAVVVEDFILRTNNADRSTLSPVRVTAGLGQLLYRARIPMLRQQPSEAKTTASDDRLKSWGLYDSEGGMNHARDGDRHNIMWLRKCKDPRMGRVRREFCWPHIYGKTRVDGVLTYGPYYAGNMNGSVAM